MAQRPLQTKIELVSWLVLAVALGVSALLASANFTLGILAGGLLSILNFYGLCRSLKAAFGQIARGGGIGKSAVIFKYLLRLALTGFILCLLLVKTKVNVFGLVIGLSTVVMGIIFSVILAIVDKSYLEEV